GGHRRRVAGRVVRHRDAPRGARPLRHVHRVRPEPVVERRRTGRARGRAHRRGRGPTALLREQRRWRRRRPHPAARGRARRARAVEPGLALRADAGRDARDDLPPRRAARIPRAVRPGGEEGVEAGRTPPRSPRQRAAPAANAPARSLPAVPPPGRRGEGVGRPPGWKGGVEGAPPPTPAVPGGRGGRKGRPRREDQSLGGEWVSRGGLVVRHNVTLDCRRAASPTKRSYIDPFVDLAPRSAPAVTLCRVAAPPRERPHPQFPRSSPTRVAGQGWGGLPGGRAGWKGAPPPTPAVLMSERVAPTHTRSSRGRSGAEGPPPPPPAVLGWKGGGRGGSPSPTPAVSRGAGRRDNAPAVPIRSKPFPGTRRATSASERENRTPGGGWSRCATSCNGCPAPAAAASGTTCVWRRSASRWAST